ncbi:MAG: nitrilase-related carbon-nitrogen hydrolase [Sphingomonas sp.]
MGEIIKAAIVQDSPVPLAVGESIERATQLAKTAIETGAKVIAFGEGFLGGHPAWLEHVPGPALWDHPGTKELHALLLRQAIRGNDPRLSALQWAVDIAGVLISVGGYERVRSSLFSTQFLFRPKAPPLLHRKLIHSAGERMLLGSGRRIDARRARGALGPRRPAFLGRAWIAARARGDASCRRGSACRGLADGARHLPARLGALCL